MFDLIEEGGQGTQHFRGFIQQWTDGLAEAIPLPHRVQPPISGRDRPRPRRQRFWRYRNIRDSRIGYRHADFTSNRTGIRTKPEYIHVLTRNDDRFVSLRDRSHHNASADLFLSIHANAAESSDLWGVETIH